MKSFYRILFLFTMTITPLAALQSQDLSGVAVLVEGTVQSFGLPGFLPNRIPALSGRYKTADGTSILVWATYEPVSFNPAYWQEKVVDKNHFWFRQTEDKQQLWCLARTVPMRLGMEKYSKTLFMMSAGSDIPAESCLSFFNAFIDRTEFFFSSANHVGDISFPAILVNTIKKL